ncbi:MAG: EamA family transporter [Propionibacteriaceae bacterium]|jgi:inner membrane transporter RhtA|nr:EamA family transporter [Propionibacteriaceae bacterium]
MRKAILMTLGAIIVVQLGSAFAKDLFDVAGPLTMAWLRVTMAGLILIPFVRPRLRGRTRRDWLVLGGYALALIGMNVTFYQAIARIPIGLAVTIEFLGPLGVAVAKSRGVRDLLWVGLAAAGVVLLGWSPGSLTVTGVIFALIAGACWAAYILITPHVGVRWSEAEPVLLATAFGALVLVVPVLTLYADRLMNPWVWIIGLLVGLLSSVIPYILELTALKTLDQRIFSILMSIEPAMAALSALVILGERLSATDVLAMTCVIAASIGITWTAARQNSSKPGGV